MFTLLTVVSLLAMFTVIIVRFVKTTGSQPRNIRTAMITAVFWAITQRVVAIPSNSSRGPIGCLETSVRNYHYSLRNNPEERSSHLRSSGNLNPNCSSPWRAFPRSTVSRPSLSRVTLCIPFLVSEQWSRLNLQVGARTSIFSYVSRVLAKGWSPAKSYISCLNDWMRR